MTRKPPIGGPTTGPISPGQVVSAIARTISALLAERSTTSRPTGDISAAPAPCSRRAPTNSLIDWLAPHMIEASVNTAIAAQNTVRGPNRSASQPLAGIVAASASM